MNGFSFILTCPNCGGTTEPLTQSRPIAGTEARAVARCTSCHRDWLIVVHLRPVPISDAVRQAQKTERAKEPSYA